MPQAAFIEEVERTRRLRRWWGISQERLAAGTPFSQSTIARIELHQRPVTASELAMIAGALVRLIERGVGR